MPINICSPTLYPCESYGVLAHRLSKHLAELGIETNSVDRWCPQLPPRRDGSIMLGWPVEFPQYDAWQAPGPRVALTMFESTVLPSGWCDILNQMDAVIVPSRFCYEVFERAGVTVPLHIIPLGISEVYQPCTRSVGDTLTFLAIGDRGLRKGSQEAIQAFRMAFGADPRYRLIIKTRAPKTIDLFPGGNIEVIQQDMTEQELYELYCRCHVMIAANRGEGFGLLPRDFVATGGIALATGWGGTADDISKWGWPIAYTLGKADWAGQPGTEGQDLGDWALPVVSQLSVLLRSIADRPEFYQSQTANAAANVRRLYSWPRFAEQVSEVFQRAA